MALPLTSVTPACQTPVEAVLLAVGVGICAAGFCVVGEGIAVGACVWVISGLVSVGDVVGTGVVMGIVIACDPGNAVVQLMARTINRAKSAMRHLIIICFRRFNPGSS